MKAHAYLPEDEMIRRALDALMVALGPVETTRFLSLPQQRRLDSVERRRRWQAALNEDRFLTRFSAPQKAPLTDLW